MTNPKITPLVYAEILAQFRFDVEAIPRQQVAFDASSDAVQVPLQAPDSSLIEDEEVGSVGNRADGLSQQLAELFPFRHFSLVAEGRLAEFILFQMLGGRGKTVLHTPLSTNTLKHLELARLRSVVLRHPGHQQKRNTDWFQGGISLPDWEEVLYGQAQKRIGFLYLQAINRLSGGFAVSMQQISELANLAKKQALPLLLDGSGIFSNAAAIQAHEPGFANRSLWSIVHEFCNHADGLLMDFRQDVGLTKGALLAFNDAKWHGRVQDWTLFLGSGLSQLDRSRIAKRFYHKVALVNAVTERYGHIAALHAQWSALGLPLSQRYGTSQIMLKVADFLYPGAYTEAAEALRVWLFKRTGIRFAVCKDVAWLSLRLAVGSSAEIVDQIGEQLGSVLLGLWRNEHSLPDLRPLAPKKEARSGYQVYELEKRAPLSFSQQRLWLLYRIDPEDVAYNLCSILRLRGPLQADCLQASLQAITYRQESLRTSFPVVGDEPYQLIRPSLTFSLPSEDLQTLPKSQRLAEVQRRFQQAAQTRFDLAQDQLVRFQLLVTAPAEHLLIISYHHIITDGWSFGVLLKELASFYQAFALGQQPKLPILPMQYAEYAKHQRESFSPEVLAKLLDYWQKQLANLPTALELPTDRSRPSVMTSQGARYFFCFPTDFLQGLKEVAKSHQVTLYMLLLATFKVLLLRYSEQQDVVVGAPIANRNRQGIEALMGFFVNTLVLRTDLSGDPTFSQLLKRVRETLLGAYKHQDMPFEQLVDALKPERSLAHTPLFQVMFAFQNVPLPSDEFCGIQLDCLNLEHPEDPAFAWSPNDRGISLFELTFELIERPEGLVGAVEYNIDLFDADRIERMVGHYRCLLQGVLANPTQPISTLPLMEDEERQRLLVGWNQTTTDYEERCLHSLFEEWAERQPEALAVVGPGLRLSYGALNTQANRLAHYLHLQGIQAQDRVAICLSRSVTVAQALLGILKAGAAYLPLDPSYPPERIAYMLKDAAPRLLLTESTLLSSLPESAIPVFCLDQDELPSVPTQHPLLPDDPDRLAYIIYTSGSTGQPKGVCCGHRGVVNLLADFQHRAPLAEGMAWSAWTSLSFDVSVYELFGPLCSGGVLHLVPEEVRVEGRAFCTWLADHAIESTYVPPFMLPELDRWVTAHPGISRLQRMLVGVEPISEALLASFITRIPGLHIVNGYGPTEATVCCSLYSVPEKIPSHQEPSRRTPIGGPVQNSQLFVLDAMGQPVPIGIPGELFVGGVGLASGYLDRPELTEQSFARNPFGEGRLYRTGDRVRYLPDGNLVFQGRNDHQVKIRGYRVELGEIETILLDHPTVAEAVAVVREDTPNRKMLVAYMVPEVGTEETDLSLRQHLRKRLPEFMVPSALVWLDAMPLSPNGKLDRKALPTPESGLTKSYVAARTPAESQLVEIWCEVLKREQVGIDDNFFELGGDSILGIQVVSRANRAGLSLNPKQTFEHQTIAELAMVAGTNKTHSIQADQDIVLGEVSLTPIQHWFLEQDWVLPDYWNQALLLQVSGLTINQVSQAIAALLQQHDALRMRFQALADGWYQHNTGILDLLPCHYCDLSGLSTEKRNLDLLQETQAIQTSLSLEQGPLVGVGLFELDKGQQRLFLAIHHLVVDGVSWRIVLEDLQTALQQIQQDQVIELGEKTSSLQQWSRALLTYAKESMLATEMDYWQGLSHCTAQPLPQDFPAGRNYVIEACTVVRSLGAEATQTLLQKAGKAYRTTVDDLLLTALAQCFHNWQPGTALWLHLEGHGREDILEGLDLSRTVGWFTALYPICLEAPKTFSSADWIKSIKQQLRQIPGRGLGYGLLRYLHPELGHTLKTIPTPQVVFNYLGQFDLGKDASGGTTLQLATETTASPLGPDNPRTHLLEINAVVNQGCLQLRWTYSHQVHQEKTVVRLADDYLESLHQLLDHCLSPEAGGYTPSDFPLAGLDQSELDRILKGRVPLEALYPLAPLQEGMLFHALYQETPEENQSEYFQQLGCELHGSADPDLFERAWQAVVARHGALRTSFLWEGLQYPLQQVLCEVPIHLERLDWSDRSAAEQCQCWQALKTAQRSQGFDLTQAPLLRLHWIRLAPQHHQFLWSHHHIVLDGWSLPLVLGEVLSHYAALDRGMVPALPASGHYEDFIAWLGTRDQVAEIAFWGDYLAGFTVPTPLPEARRVDDGPVQPATYELHLSRVTSQALASLARATRVTLSTILQGAWALLLGRYARETEVLFGLTVAGRPATLPKVESTVGLYINTLPLRVSLPETTPLDTWLGELQQAQSALRQYEHSALATIQKQSALEPGQGLFESLLVFENYPIDQSLAEGERALDLRDLTFTEQTNYPLVLTVLPEIRLGLRFSYNAHLFEEAAIVRLAERLQILLTGMVADSKQPLAQISLLTETDRQQIQQWNDTTIRYPQQEYLLHQLFEEQARRSPKALALVYQDHSLSYQALEQQTNRLAHLLLAKGVTSDTLVGVYALRSLEMVIALYGILKAGGAYLPLDPSLPQERLDFILDDAQVPLVLSHSPAATGLVVATEVLLLDRLAETLAAQPNTRPNPVVTPDHLAYCIYTSGSTGRPKGVLVSHRAIVNRLLWTQAEYPLDQTDRVLQKTPFSFDVSVWEFFWPLFSGSCLVIARPEGHKDPAYLVHLIQQQNITTLHFVPSMLGLFLEAEGVADCVSLRRVICSGEALPLDYTRRFFSLLQAELHNLYGPTEAAVDVSYWACTADIPYPSVPIGRPVANTQLYVLDATLTSVPVGMVGELHIGGNQLARGYLNRPELTKKQFIPDPYTTGGRLYKTGDLARWLAEGLIEYVGRIDFQVKVRGFRIELGEIETVLGAQPGVKDTVVTARTDPGSDKRLVAYIVPSAGSTLTIAEIREALAQQLVEYMVPSAFVILEALPLSPNGKVDRKALPAPETSQLALSHAYVAPRTALETTLAEVWAEVLGLPRVGVYDHFFELGGDSILSIQVIGRLARLGWQLSPRQLFQYPTVAELVGTLQRSAGTVAEQDIAPGVIPLNPIQHWFFQRIQHTHWNQALLLDLCRPLPTTFLEQAIAALIRQHDGLRTQFRPTSEGWQQYLEVSDLVPFRVETLSAWPEAEQSAAIQATIAAVQRSFQWTSGPLFQAVLFDQGAQAQQLLLVAHHLVVDGVSWRILLEDLQQACHQLLAKQPVNLGLKTVSIRQWALHLQQHSAALSPWQAQPTVFWSEPPGLVSNCCTQVTVSTTSKLTEAGQAYGTTVEELLLAALAQTLCRWSGQDSIGIDLEGHGRETLVTEMDLSRTVGWFTALYPAIFHLPQSQQSKATLCAVKEQLRALPIPRFGYGLHQQLAPTEATHAQVLFNYLGRLESQTDALFTPAILNDTRAPDSVRSHTLEIEAHLTEEELQLTWVYPESLESTITDLAQRYTQHLQQLLTHCLSSEAGGYTPSDFPLANLDQVILDRLLGSVRGVEALYPLSPLQEGILFHVRYEPSTQYFQQLACELHGAVDSALFKQAWQAVVARHPSLRTHFFWENLERPLQCVSRKVSVALLQQDWSAYNEAEAEARWITLQAEDRTQGFEITTAPLLRLHWIRQSPTRHRFLWSYHHLILDGWSLPLVLGEVLNRYAALRQGAVPVLANTGRYEDFITWLGTHDSATEAAFWSNYLAGFKAPTPLPEARRTMDHPAHQPANHALRLSLAASQALEALARETRVTLSTLLQGAWALLLSRYARESDVVFGLTVAGRPAVLPEIESTVGLYINTLPLRVQIPEKTPLNIWLGTLQEAQSTLRQYEHSALVTIQGQSELASGQGLFESLLVFENYPIDSALAEGDTALEMRELHVFEQTNYPLLLTVLPDTQMGLRFSYDPQRFEAEAMERLAEHLRILLEGMHATCPVNALPWLSKAEQATLLYDWNQTQQAYPKNCLHQLVEQQAIRTPEAIAVVYQGQSLRYAELDGQANRLAHYLQGLGVGPEVLVGLCLDRSLHLIVGLLGILKAGGAYVPLDPDYPWERLAFMLEDAAAPILLTQSTFSDQLPVQGLTQVVIDRDAKQIAACSADPVPCHVKPNHRAYVIYTSGSTGKPKGVELQHQGVVNFLYSMAKSPGLEPSDGWLALTSLSFDIAVLELFLPLSVGARVLLIDRATAMDGQALAIALVEQKATIMQATPASWQLLLQQGWRNPQGIRMLCGGEAMPPEMARQLLATSGELWNLYGPTETTIWSTVHQVQTADGAIPIGRPIANTSLYLLDPCDQPVPIGVAGELCIGGDGVARGYLGQPTLTEERFSPNPFTPGERFYRTGDLARYRSDGVLECLGRIDFQVKLRGHRIELGEIETRLSAHPGVQEAITTVRNDRLIAYLLGCQEEATELRRYLSARLPDYMIPSVFIDLEAFPLTPNGKVDRKALPDPEPQVGRSQEHYTPPRTPVEEALCQIWAELLDLPQASIHDHFFEHGGHSLTAAQAVARIRSHLQIDLPLRTLFEAPTVAELALALGQLGRTSIPVIQALPRQTPIALSYAQQRLWFLQQLASSSAYHMPVALHLEGELDLTVLAQCFTEVIRRHEVLRTCFPAQNETACQKIQPPLVWQIPLTDLTTLSEQAQQAEVHTQTLHSAAALFDVSQGPLLRTTLLRLAEQQHVLLLCMHHIISDGWSIGVIIQEIETLYPAYLAGKASPMAELPIQYADYSQWQWTQWQQSKARQIQLDYWRERLAHPPLLDLPLDRPRPAVQRFHGARWPVQLSASQSQALQNLSQQQGVTLFMTLMAAYQVLLYRYSGQTDLCVGTPVANRGQTVLEPLIGCFVNTLVIRGEWSEAIDFCGLLAQIQTRTLEAYHHQELPFEHLVEALGVVRDLSHTPLFQTMFVWQNLPISRVQLAGLTIEVLDITYPIAKFDLMLELFEGESGIYGAFEYNTDLFDPATIQQMAEHFTRLLGSILAQPDLPVSNLPMLTERERQQLLVDWNATSDDYPQCSLHRSFEQWVERQPEAPALRCEGQCLSYAKLNEQADCLAHYLQTHGVGPGDRIGICLARGSELPGALLATLKVGAAYVPLDPSYPSERLAYMLKDAAPKWILTDTTSTDNLPTHTLPSLCLDQEKLPPGKPKVLPDDPDRLAYVIYTSGSTGRPKGVCCAHRGVQNLLANFQRLAPLSPGMVASAWTSTSFDVSVYELFAPLCSGGILHLVPNSVRTEAPAFCGWLHQSEVQSAYIPPFMLQDLKDWLRTHPNESKLQRLLVGVEPIAESLLATFQQHIPGLQVINGYGPTEATVCCSLYAVPQGPASERRTPIGRPLANSQLYCLDQALQPVPIGVVGSLYVGGPGLAQGYLDRPQLTDKSFIPNPFGEGRLYATGDQVRYLPDGNLLFLGRNDQQVKIRGYRIELEEIEAILLEHTEVKEAVIMVREDQPGLKRLVAYMVPTNEQPPESYIFKEYLRKQLADYMLPGAFCFLEAMPLSPNGKLDRKALPPPPSVQPETVRKAPHTPAEEALLGIWVALLHQDTLGVEDDFFELGGHSLLATQVVTRVRQLFEVELPLRVLFEAPTIASLAQQIEILQKQNVGVSRPPLVVVSRKQDLPLSFAQQRLWFLDQLQPETAFYTIPVALRIEGALEAQVLAQVFQEIVRRHEVLCTDFQQREGEPWQRIQAPQPWQLEVEDLSELTDIETETSVRARAKQEAQRPFPLDQAPLLRTTLLRLEPQAHVLLLTLHHIIADGWSMGILIREVAALYQAFILDQPSPLSPLPIQYADFANWQRQWLRDEVLEIQLAYWRKHLQGAVALELTTDFPRPAVQRYHGAHYSFTIDKATTGGLRALAKTQGVTLYMMLLAAFKVLLYRYTGQQDICVGTPVANRSQGELELLIGFFVNTLALRTQMQSQASFVTLLEQVREVTLGAYAHQDTPFERLVEELGAERNMSHAPLFQVMFSLQNQPLDIINLPNLRLTPLSVESGISKFDLMLEVREEGKHLEAVLEYATDLFEKTTITRMADHLRILLQGIVADPTQVIANLPLLSEAEAHQQLVEWNHTKVTPLSYASVQEMFEAQVAQTPKAKALLYGTHPLEYQTLNQQANCLAHYLLALGVKRGTWVGICLHRSPKMLVGVLGILKAGGAYIPMDPSYPQERLAYMLEDSGATVLLTQETLLSNLPKYQETTLCLDRDWSSIAEQSNENPPNRTRPDDLLYMIYTSGSTGRPKGAFVCHRGELNLLQWYTQHFGMLATDRVLLVSAFGFDLTQKNLFGPLVVGAALVLPEYEDYDPAYLQKLIESAKVTWINSAPSAFYPLVEKGHSTALATLRYVFLGGEPITLSKLVPWFDQSQCQLINSYGPTECTDIAASYTLGLSLEYAKRPIPIGRPNNNVRLYVFDQNGQPLPIGVVGELYIAGAGVGLGYLNDPEKTAESFLDHPLEPQGKIYRTGDLVRYRPDGALEYIGRLDFQIKLRGLRIELGEIEYALQKEAKVQESLVLVYNEQLIAYLLSSEANLDTTFLRVALAKHLPEYMIPSIYIMLTEWPLTPNGKIDRKALPAPKVSTESREYTAPRNALEEILVAIYGDVLNLGRVGIYDHFFELGGHSLLATQVVARINSACQIRLPVRALFEAPAIAELAQTVDAIRWVAEGKVEDKGKEDEEGEDREEWEI